jgi:MYXO-CTERM domain-containing protein
MTGSYRLSIHRLFALPVDHTAFYVLQLPERAASSGWALGALALLGAGRIRRVDTHSGRSGPKRRCRLPR